MKKTAEKHFLKIKRGIAGARHRFGWKWKFGVAAASAILAIGAIWWLALPLPQNYETEIPRRAKSHSAEITACDYRPETGAIIEIKFLADQPAQIPYPEYRVEEAAAEGRTRVIFENVSRLADGFDWQQIAANPLIDAVKWEIADSRLILEISRKGPYSPARIETQGVFAKVILPAAEKNHPAISGQKPAPDSFAFPMRHTVSFEAVLAAPLKNATIFVNEQAIPFRQEPIGPGKYLSPLNRKWKRKKSMPCARLSPTRKIGFSSASGILSDRFPAPHFGKRPLQISGMVGTNQHQRRFGAAKPGGKFGKIGSALHSKSRQSD